MRGKWLPWLLPLMVLLHPLVLVHVMRAACVVLPGHLLSSEVQSVHIIVIVQEFLQNLVKLKKNPAE